MNQTANDLFTIEVLFPITSYPDLPTPKYFCQYPKHPVTVFSYFGLDFPPRCTTNQSKLNVSKDNFSILLFVKTECEPTFSIILMSYKTGTLTFGRLYFNTSARVILDQKTEEHFIQKQCTMCAAFTDADFLEQMMSGQSLFPCILTPLR